MPWLNATPRTAPPGGAAPCGRGEELGCGSPSYEAGRSATPVSVGLGIYGYRLSKPLTLTSSRGRKEFYVGVGNREHADGPVALVPSARWHVCPLGHREEPRLCVFSESAHSHPPLK